MDEYGFITELLAKMGMGGGIVGTAAYFIHRKITANDNSDKVDEKAISAMESLQKQLESERKENMELRLACERVAEERNEAVKDLGNLQGEVKALEKQVNILTDQVKKLEDENRHLANEIRMMHLQMLECFEKFKSEKPNA